MPQIFEEHDGIVKEKTAEYQKALKLRRERFVEELEAYNHQVLSIKITLKLYLLVKRFKTINWVWIQSLYYYTGWRFLYIWKCGGASKVHEKGPDIEHQTCFMQRKDWAGNLGTKQKTLSIIALLNK